MTKPTAASLGIDLDRQQRRRSGSAERAIEVAFVDALGLRAAAVRVAGAR